ncbi:MAG: glycosyltransferase family 2 protein [Deltaproteobacteria bacterium]|nr:glycosyltransferase family 2 protein [Deltaproteobacteria bacterium]
MPHTDLSVDNEIIDVSIVIVSFNTKDVTRQCLEHVRKHAAAVKHEVLVVDNASGDGSADMVAAEFPEAHLIRSDENKGFAGGNNPAMKIARGRYILLLNSDAFLAEGVLEKTIQYMDDHPDAGVLGCKLTDPDGTMQPSARMQPGPLNKILHITGLAARFSKSKFFGRVDYTWWDHDEPKRVGWVVGAYFLIRRETMEKVGVLDERYFLYFEEIDYCLSARRTGLDVVFYPHARVIHLGGQSSVKTGQRVSAKGRQMIAIRITSEFRFYRKLHGWMHVLFSAGIELIWNGIVYLKNSFRRSPAAAAKKNEAKMMIELIFRTLREDNWGRGVV